MEPFNVEDKLKVYRQRKTLSEKFQRLRKRINGVLMLGSSDKSEEQTSTSHKESEIEEKIPLDLNEVHDLSDESSELKTLKFVPENSLHFRSNGESNFLKYALRVMYFTFWVTLYIIAIELQFGIVFLMFSVLIGIFLNTRTGPKMSNEISAYSVFNKNCESIDGTLKAEQLQRELGIL